MAESLSSALAVLRHWRLTEKDTSGYEKTRTRQNNCLQKDANTERQTGLHYNNANNKQAEENNSEYDMQGVRETILGNLVRHVSR